VPAGTRLRINLVAVLDEDPTTPLNFLGFPVAMWQQAMTAPELRFKDRTL
jgi:hypothetical protein